MCAVRRHHRPHFRRHGAREPVTPPTWRDGRCAISRPWHRSAAPTRRLSADGYTTSHQFGPYRTSFRVDVAPDMPQVRASTALGAGVNPAWQPGLRFRAVSSRHLFPGAMSVRIGKWRNAEPPQNAPDRPRNEGAGFGALLRGLRSLPLQKCYPHFKSVIRERNKTSPCAQVHDRTEPRGEIPMRRSPDVVVADVTVQRGHATISTEISATASRMSTYSRVLLQPLAEFRRQFRECAVLFMNL